jgi:pyruvate dehydrogenase E2 component (dihydrolipoamide acetyltransferase)
MDILMPQLGETVAEGKIAIWFKQVGDRVNPGDNLFEIETDKVSMEVPATSAGVIAEIRVAKGEVAPVGAVVAVLADSAEAAAAHKPAPAAAKPIASTGAPVAAVAAAAPQPAQSAPKAVAMDPFREVRTPERNFGPARLSGGITVTPLARRLAGENGIDLSRVKGSGPHGRIVARDVEQHVGAPVAAAALPAGPSVTDLRALYRDTPFEEVPLDAMRRTIAARLVQAKQSIPHFYLTADVGLDALLKVRAQANEAAPAGEAGYKLSVNDFVIKALALALMRIPAANAVFADDRTLRFRRADIGVAVALDGGLLTPVIRAANEKSLSAISNEMRSLAERARARKLKPEEYQGGVSAVSNLGMHGVREFSAIINPPQSTILAVGAAQRRPVEAEDGSVRFESQMTVTLSCDHRVIDGALGAELLAALKGYLERPLTMLV